MRAGVVITLIAAIGLVLQSTLFLSLPLGGAMVDIPLILGVYLALNHHTVAGAFGAFLLGYAQDAASGSPSGLNASGMLVIFVIVYLTCRRLWVDNVVSKVVVVFLASLIKMIVVILFSVMVGSNDGWQSVTLQGLGNGALSAALAPAVFALVRAAGVQPEREAE